MAVDFFMTIQDHEAVNAMRRLAAGSQRDIPLEAGESAVAGLAGLIRITDSPSRAAEVGIDAQSRILLISTECATAPGVYAELVGESDMSASVRARQQAWLAKA